MLAITSRRKPFIQRSVIALLLPLCAMMLLFHCACSKKEEESSTQQNVNTEATPTVANTSIREAPTPMSQDPIANNLVSVMKDWSGTEVATLDRNIALSSMWLLRHSSTTPYDPDGIEKLIKRIKKNSFFKNTPSVRAQANKLKRGFFVVGGGIQNQGQLYDFLAA